MGWAGRDIITIKDFARKDIDRVLEVAKEMVPIASGRKRSNLAENAVMASLFFEPSTRTRLSFETACQRLGGTVITLADAEASSLRKGETLADTVRMVDGYSDVIVLRHPQEGSARLAAEFAERPVINAGDGAGQHPTQTMLDLFTIQAELGAIAGKNVVLLGDLKYGRTVHSLAVALAMYGCKVSLVAPPSLLLPKEVVEACGEHGAEPRRAELPDVLPDADVLYVTRIQKERFPDAEEYARVASSYRITPGTLADAKKSLIVLHPLPRVGEISPDVDATPHAKYFKQAFYGVPVRMAILALVTGAKT